MLLVICGGVGGSLVGNLHHVKIHQSGVLVLVLLCQVQEAILLVEGYESHTITNTILFCSLR